MATTTTASAAEHNGGDLMSSNNNCLLVRTTSTIEFDNNDDVNCGGDSRTPLYKRLERRDWDAVEHFIDSGDGYWPNDDDDVTTTLMKMADSSLSPSDQARTWVTCVDDDPYNEEKDDGNNVNKMMQMQQQLHRSILPLHLAIMRDAPLSIIQRLVELYPLSLRCPPLPLHIALRYEKSNKELIEFLFRAFPPALAASGGELGVPPIDYVLKANEDHRARTFNILIEIAPDKVTKAAIAKTWYKMERLRASLLILHHQQESREPEERHHYKHTEEAAAGLNELVLQKLSKCEDQAKTILENMARNTIIRAAKQKNKKSQSCSHDGPRKPIVTSSVLPSSTKSMNSSTTKAASKILPPPSTPPPLRSPKSMTMASSSSSSSAAKSRILGNLLKHQARYNKQAIKPRFKKMMDPPQRESHVHETNTTARSNKKSKDIKEATIEAKENTNNNNNNNNSNSNSNSSNDRVIRLFSLVDNEEEDEAADHDKGLTWRFQARISDSIQHHHSPVVEAKSRSAPSRLGSKRSSPGSSRNSATCTNMNIIANKHRSATSHITADSVESEELQDIIDPPDLQYLVPPDLSVVPETDEEEQPKLTISSSVSTGRGTSNDNSNGDNQEAACYYYSIPSILQKYVNADAKSKRSLRRRQCSQRSISSSRQRQTPQQHHHDKVYNVPSSDAVSPAVSSFGRKRSSGASTVSTLSSVMMTSHDDDDTMICTGGTIGLVLSSGFQYFFSNRLEEEDDDDDRKVIQFSDKDDDDGDDDDHAPKVIQVPTIDETIQSGKSDCMSSMDTSASSNSNSTTNSEEEEEEESATISSEEASTFWTVDSIDNEDFSCTNNGSHESSSNSSRCHQDGSTTTMEESPKERRRTTTVDLDTLLLVGGNSSDEEDDDADDDDDTTNSLASFISDGSLSFSPGLVVTKCRRSPKEEEEEEESFWLS